MSSLIPSSRRFLFLCLESRQSLYEPLLECSEHRVAFVEDVPALLVRSVGAPPIAVLIDIVTSVRLGVAQLRPIYELDMVWPVLRCKHRPDGSAVIFAADPSKNAEFAAALDALASGDSSWRRANVQRYFVRVKRDARVRFRAFGDGSWRIGNLHDLSIAGAFLITYDPLDAGSRVELEVLDIARTPVPVLATVVRSRRWDEGAATPGMGVVFDGDELHPEFQDVVTEEVQRNRIYVTSI